MMSEPQTLPGHMPPPLFFPDLTQSLARLQKGDSAKVPGETPLDLLPEWVCWFTPRQPWAPSRLLFIDFQGLLGPSVFNSHYWDWYKPSLGGFPPLF